MNKLNLYLKTHYPKLPEKMNIHFVSNYQFINNTINKFEHYYPDQNIFYLHAGKEKGSRIKENNRVIFTNLIHKRNTTQIIQRIQDGDNLFIHHLSAFKAALALKIIKERKVKTYWIFYGGDLYGILHQKNKINLYDNNFFFDAGLKKYFKQLLLKFKLFFLSVYLNEWLFKAKEKFIRKLDYFCFWNKYDYLLLKQHFETNAVFKDFRYSENNPSDWKINESRKNPFCLIVNHSASMSGNHLTILKHLNKIDTDRKIKKVIVPLSYGSGVIRNQVINYGTDELSHCFEPILDYLSPNDYFKTIGQASVAIWGHKRQEGGANLFFLLANGVKVFFRKENNLLSYFKDKGYCVYEFETDLKSIKDLTPLEPEKQAHNRKLILEEFTKEHLGEIYENLIS